MSDTPAIEPTLDELADLADVLGDPLRHSLVLLEMIRDERSKTTVLLPRPSWR